MSQQSSADPALPQLAGPERAALPEPRSAPRATELDDLRQILVGRETVRVSDVESRLGALEERLGDDEALAEAVTPLMHTVIRRQIHEAREEMIEALYPIIGSLIGRAVTEAMRDLARQVDARLRQGADPRLWWWRLRARLGGVSGDELALRAYLPFKVTDVFLIHRETGLLLQHATDQPSEAADADLISGMLTAIRDFVKEAFGRGGPGAELDEIQYGRQRILLESGHFTYAAVVVDGIEPPGFRTDMRDRLHAIEHAHKPALQRYAGDATVVEPARLALQSVLETGRPRPLSRTQKALLGGLAGTVAVAALGVVGLGTLAWRALRPAPAPVVAVVPTATATATIAPSPTTPPPTPSPAPHMGIVLGNAWLREGSAADTAPIIVVSTGDEVEVLESRDDWLRVRWTSESGSAVVGWISARWIALTAEASAFASPTPTAPAAGAQR